MAAITGKLYNLDATSVLTSAAVLAYTAASQPVPPLVDLDGNAHSPVGGPASNTVSDSYGAYQLTGLTAGLPYHLYIQPSSGNPYWLYWQMTDPVVTVTPCVLFGTAETADLVLAGGVIWAALEDTAVVSGGLVVPSATIVVPVGPLGQFTLPLWPTLSLTPNVLYRVSVGHAVWRGSIPSQASIRFDAWTALTTTQRLS